MRVRRFPPRPTDYRPRSAPQYPYNQKPDTSMCSQPEYDIKIERDIYVPVSDGERMAMDIYRPDAEGRFPALLAISSYTKEMQATDSPSGGNEAGDMEFFVKRGYAHVVADARGTGHSGGRMLLFDKREIQDGVELVEWISQQPWCNGNVGMIGMSYYAINQLLIAKRNPPQLKCIFAHDPIYDLYRDTIYHGGKFSNFPFLYAFLLVSGQFIFMRGERGKDKTNIWGDLARLMYETCAQHHKFDDEWMHERSSYWSESDIEVPLYVGSGWEYAVGLHLRGVFDAFWQAKGPRRMLVGPPQVPFRPYSSWRIESLRWYDRWLKGIDTGVEEDPPVNIWIMGRNRWRCEQEWPLERTKYTDLYLKPKGNYRKIGVLSHHAPEREDRTLSYISSPLNLAHIGIPQLVYRTPVLRQEVEVTGHITLRLFASCTARDTSFFVRFSDEDEDGTYKVISRGWLKASHREIDEERSLPYRPFHPHQREEPLEPGKIYEFLIEILPVCNVFYPGHRIRIEISCIDSQYHDFPYTHFPSPYIGKVNIHSSPEHPSSITLPVVDSELAFDNAGANLKFEEEFGSMYATRGKERVFSDANEFMVRGWKAMRQGPG
ncbi:MAG: CocE/NonD family hydrolase [Actinobacteria bacterium]|nr:CocE/NonD family hydrolase [Actinomycetota bacterium]